MRPPTTLDAMLVVAVFSRQPGALDWARARLQDHFGPIGLASPVYSFHHTAYYAGTMGTDLQKQLLTFERLVPLEGLALCKKTAIGLEEELRAAGTFPEPRPVNIDPGLLTLGKFMLATTKDQAHRLYLSKGIFAEVTLRYCDGEFVPWDWTYADYREPAVRQFLNEARDRYKVLLRHLGEISG